VRRQSERHFTQEVIDVAADYGWRTFHLRDRDSVHIVRGRGFPDLVMYRKGETTIELVAAELKRDYDSEPTEEQKGWLEALGQRIPAYTWRPEDWDKIEDVLVNGPTDEGVHYPVHSRLAHPQSANQIPANLGSIMTDLAETIEDSEMRSGDHASLRRMNLSHPDAPIFWRLMSRDGMPRNPDTPKWALIMHGIALMSHGAGLAHNSRMPVGRALYEGDGNSSAAFYSDSRLAKLLAARDSTLHQLLARLFRMLGNKRCAFDWREMARFILNEGYDEERAESARVEIARAYYRAESYNARQSQE